MEISSRQIRGCRPSLRYQRYYNRINILYYDGQLPPVNVYTAPLLKVTAYSQKEAQENNQVWTKPGEYGILGQEENGEWCIILDRATAVFHSIITKQTVLHETAHLKLHPYQGHGKKFDKEIRRLAALGALDGLI